MANPALQNDELLQTPFQSRHIDAGGKIVPFAGYSMPVQYKLGVMAEHLHTRSAAGLFDVSHMGHVMIHGDDMVEKFEKLVVGDISELSNYTMKYSLFTTESGGVIDDLMITRVPGGLYLVVNASRKHVDVAHMQSHLPRDRVEYLPQKALLALQGPKAAATLSKFIDGCGALKFMHAATTTMRGIPVHISRSGYTGEDGYEIAVDDTHAGAVADMLLLESDVQWIGLGARDTLRLEAGLCLYGHELDETTTPIEADLKWTIGKRRRTSGGFLGSSVILPQMQNGAPRKRVGIRPDGRAIARDGVEIQNLSGQKIGHVTSGTFGPTVNGPVAIGYVDAAQSAIGNKINLMVRGAPVAATISSLPFVPYRYYRG